MTEIPKLALTIRQPWAWAIMHAGKDIENRTWSTKFRGAVFIHAAKGCTRPEYENAEDFILCLGAGRVPTLDSLERGGIVGIAEIWDCVSDDSDNPWFVGDFGFRLRHVRPVPFVACRGALGFWRVPDDTREAVRVAMGVAA